MTHTHAHDTRTHAHTHTQLRTRSHTHAHTLAASTRSLHRPGCCLQSCTVAESADARMDTGIELSPHPAEFAHAAKKLAQSTRPNNKAHCPALPKSARRTCGPRRRVSMITVLFALASLIPVGVAAGSRLECPSVSNRGVSVPPRHNWTGDAVCPPELTMYIGLVQGVGATASHAHVTSQCCRLSRADREPHRNEPVCRQCRCRRWQPTPWNVSRPGQSVLLGGREGRRL
jgi:hypothetical protein